LAWVGLSRVRKWQANVNLIPTDEGYRLAREAFVDRYRQFGRRPFAYVALSHPPNPEAFDAYMQGYYFFEKDTNKDTEMVRSALHPSALSSGKSHDHDHTQLFRVKPA
jgi:hypothetical protein